MENMTDKNKLNMIHTTNLYLDKICQGK
jgi:hypothetical protein